MGTKRHTPEDVIARLRQVDVLVGQGQSVAEAIRSIGVTEVTYSLGARSTEYRDHVWSYDCVEARTHDGRKVRMLNVVDEVTRECLAIRVARKLKAIDVIDVLSDLFSRRGVAASISATCSDPVPRRWNGSAFRARIDGAIDDADRGRGAAREGH